MDPQACRQLIDRMARHYGSDLESFLDSHGLVTATKHQTRAEARHRINQAPVAALWEGDL
jgi:hypothetical protein